MPPKRHGRMQWGDGFEIETLIHCRFARSGAEIVEVPSVEKAADLGESNLHAVSDGCAGAEDAVHGVAPRTLAA